MARSSDLTPLHLGAWTAIDNDLTDARLSLERSAPAVGRLGLGADTIPAAARLEQGQRTLSATVVSAQRALRTWKRQYNAVKRRRDARLRRLRGYRRAVTAQLATYAGLRAELDRWLDQFGGERVPFGRAEEYLSNALSERQNVLNALLGLSPPAGVVASHVALQGIVEQGVRAMDNAIDGARECTRDPYCYGDDFRDSPDWREFIHSSREINARVGGLQAAWENALGRAVRKVKQQEFPPPPEV